MKASMAVAAGFGVGVLAGFWLAGANQTEPPLSVSRTTEPPSVVATIAPPATPAVGVALVWVPGEVPDALTRSIATIDGVEAVIEAVAGQVYLSSTFAADGSVLDAPSGDGLIPMEVVGFEPAELMTIDPETAGRLLVGEVLLGESSAVVRRLGAGGALVSSSGPRWTIGGVVSDGLYGAAEIVMARREAVAAGVTAVRYLLIAYSGDRATIEQEIRDRAKGEVSLRFRGPGETPFLHHGDAVLPQAVIKRIFGEFVVSAVEGDAFEIDRLWVQENIVTETIPILGPITCHRSIIPLVTAVMGDLEAAGLGELVDPETFQGCFNPRFVAGSNAISHHSWGIALDVNYRGNEQGLAATIDPRVVDIFERHGFGWGGDWLVPDPAHFEWLGG